MGREEEDTWLPDAESALKVVQPVRHPDRDQGELKQCPECGAWFFYRTSYEFLIPGSYDEQILIRLSGVEAETLSLQRREEAGMNAAVGSDRAAQGLKVFSGTCQEMHTDPISLGRRGE